MKDIKESFEHKKTINFIIAFLAIIFIALIHYTGMDIIGFSGGIILVIISRINWRCPSCGGYLGKSMSPKYYSKCGEELE